MITDYPLPNWVDEIDFSGLEENELELFHKWLDAHEKVLKEDVDKNIQGGEDSFVITLYGTYTYSQEHQHNHLTFNAPISNFVPEDVMTTLRRFVEVYDGKV